MNRSIAKFPAGSVRLTSGALAARRDEALATYSAIPVDNLLHGYRLRAGLPSAGRAMEGWSSITPDATFGQILSGLARFGADAPAGHAAQVAGDLVAGYRATVPDSGDADMHLYGWEKLSCGLLDTYIHTNDTDALDLLARTTEWASRTFDRTRSMANQEDRDGRRPNNAFEWYTLSENSYRAWSSTGEGLFRDFAELWHYDEYWGRFETAPEPGQAWDVPVWLHAYSHVNTFASAAAAYGATGDERLLATVSNAHRWITSTQAYATGGFGPGEWTVPGDGTLGNALEWRTDHAEIQCGTWASMKLASYLLQHTGDASAVDWAERLIYNGLGSSMPTLPDGRTYYYSDLSMGSATKLYHWDQWPCCSGTYVQALAHLPDLVWGRTDVGAALQLFIPSTVSWEHGGVPVSLEQVTEFPYSDLSRVLINVDAPVRFELRIRVPEWSDGFAATIRGAEAKVEAGWAIIDREWSRGDTVEIRLGATLHAEAVDSVHPMRAAVMHGPVVLAQEARFASPFTSPSLEAVPEQLEQVGALTYAPKGVAHVGDQPVGGFTPLFEVPERLPHRVYHDLDTGRWI